MVVLSRDKEREKAMKKRVFMIWFCTILAGSLLAGCDEKKQESSTELVQQSISHQFVDGLTDETEL